VPGPERIVEVEKLVVQKEVEVKEVEKIIEIEVFRSASGHVTKSPAVMLNRTCSLRIECVLS